MQPNNQHQNTLTHTQANRRGIHNLYTCWTPQVWPDLWSTTSTVLSLHCWLSRAVLDTDYRSFPAVNPAVVSIHSRRHWVLWQRHRCHLVMWRYLEGAKRPNTGPSPSTSTNCSDRKRVYDMEYESSKRKRGFNSKWAIGRPWLINCVDTGMKCLCELGYYTRF